MISEQHIVRTIKQIRVNKRMSLEELARLSGLTKGYMSKIENSEKAPPLSTLIKIAQALDTDIGVLLSTEADAPERLRLCISRCDERKEVVSRGTLYGYHYESLADKKLGRNMVPYVITAAFDEKAVFSHEGEEFIYVLEGTHEFTYGEEKYLLKRGDCVYFDSIVPHSGRSMGKKLSKVLAVMYAYKR